MAGDLPFQETLVIHDPAAPLAAPMAAATPKVLLRFGPRVEVHLGPTQAAPTAVPSISQALLSSLSDNERFGVEAMQLRATQSFATAKANRLRDGQVWDMPGCAG